MNKIEFLDRLRRALVGEITSHLIEENIRYYDEYITSEVVKGNTEERVIDALGDPRLIAKTIIDTNKTTDNQEGQEEIYENNTEHNGKTKNTRSFVLPGWLITTLVIIIFIVVIGFLTSVFFSLLPFIILISVVVFFIRLFKRN